MTVAFDISMDSVEYFSEFEGKLAGNNYREMQQLRGSAKNRTPALAAALNKLYAFSRERGFDGLHVVCEPTGCYSAALLRVARRMGHSTAWVSGEAVHKARMIENNDNGKDDIKDPRTIHMLSHMGKELVYRTLPPEYQGLRHLNQLYDVVDRQCVQAKTELHSLVKKLFCDFPMGKDFLKTPSGGVLVEKYGLSPLRIVSEGFKQFCTTMQKDAPRVRITTLRNIYTAAQSSAQHHLSPQEGQALEQAVTWTLEDLRRAMHRKEQLRGQIAQGYERLRATGEMVPIADGKVFTAFQFGRILGETGPLRDFANWRVLFKYAGLNLRKRESGTYKGRLRLSKKGRVPLRLVLGKMIFGMVRAKELFGPYYRQRKLQDPNAIGTKVMANAERKLLRMIFGMARRGEAFDENRFSTCESQYRLAA